MILADTNIWIRHLRRTENELVRLLEEDRILMHPWVRGELALGSIADRKRFIEFLAFLPQLRPAEPQRIQELIEEKRLFGRGIGWVDAALLASCAAYPCRLWTEDKRLAEIAGELGIGL